MARVTPEQNASLRALADNGDREAQYQYGHNLAHGKGIEKDVNGGLRYLRRAAVQNHDEAQIELYFALDRKKDPECWHWLICAHMNGDPLATKLLNDALHDTRYDKRAMNNKFEQVMDYIRTYGREYTENPEFMDAIEPDLKKGFFASFFS